MARQVLVIDDSDTVLAVLGEALRAAGIRAFCTSDLAQATRHLYRDAPDLVLLDVQMPLVSGTEVCRIIKSKEETKSVRVILHSDLPEAELARLTTECGADGHLTKARTLVETVAAVEALLA